MIETLIILAAGSVLAPFLRADDEPEPEDRNSWGTSDGGNGSYASDSTRSSGERQTTLAEFMDD